MLLSQTLSVKDDVILVGAFLSLELFPFHFHRLDQEVVNDGLVTQAHVNDAHSV